MSPETQVIGVLNGKDTRLEQFWGMDRLEFAVRLRAAGVVAVTGPTYSIAEEGDQRPAFHNVTMLGRHHQCWQELEDQGLAVAPNIYWRNLADLAAWSEWLSGHKVVSTVSREFGAVRRSKNQFERDLDAFVSMLSDVGRPLHVLLQGIAEGNGGKALHALTAVGCTGSVLSPRPTILGLRRRELVSDGGTVRSQPSDLAPAQLAVHNFRFLGEYLAKAEGVDSRDVQLEEVWRSSAISLESGAMTSHSAIPLP